MKTSSLPRLTFAAVLLFAAAFSACRTSSATEGEGLPGQGPQLTRDDRIEVLEGKTWVRGVVSELPASGSSTVKVRTGPDLIFSVVPLRNVRVVPRPATINVGDTVEVYDTSVFKYRVGKVLRLGTDSYAGYVWVDDQTGSPGASPTYIRRANVWTAPGAMQAGGNPSHGGDSAAEGPALGDYRCMAYSSPPNPPILIGGLTLSAGGRYTGHNPGGSGASAGTWTYDAASHTISWNGGWMATNQFGGKLEGNALIRITRSSICSKS